MCGFFGVVEFEGVVSPEQLERSGQLLEHRGPDDSGIYLSDDRKVGLYHRRLSIIDLTPRGRQPMFDVSGNFGIVYNGEIFNYQELKKELEDLGFEFKSDSDTEVILNGYLKWGEQVVDKLRGMYAFAIFDQSKHKLILFRDHVGIKPLYYHLGPERLLFASEIASIEHYPGTDLSLDDSALFDFFTYGYIPSPKTAYTNIRRMTPASILVLEDRQIRERTYWDVPFRSSGIKTVEDAVGGLQESLRDSVQVSMVSDVPVGVFLSGGLDSSTIAYWASTERSEPLETFSIGFTEPEFSETDYARRVSHHLGQLHMNPSSP